MLALGATIYCTRVRVFCCHIFCRVLLAAKLQIVINGVPVTYAVRDPGHHGLIQMHLKREVNSCTSQTLWALRSARDGVLLLPDSLVYDAIEASRNADPSRAPLVLDIGSNHGQQYPASQIRAPRHGPGCNGLARNACAECNVLQGCMHCTRQRSVLLWWFLSRKRISAG
eukprot:SAG31_NODE_16786_length_696_cov_0.775544_1_plen_170_part_00